jgi:rRNA maturation endonuclease Nob1
MAIGIPFHDTIDKGEYLQEYTARDWAIEWECSYCKAKVQKYHKCPSCGAYETALENHNAVQRNALL